MMRTTVSSQPQIIIVVCCVTLRRSAYSTAGNIRSITKDGTVTKSFGYTNPSWPDLLTSVTANGTTKDVLYEGQSQTSDLPTSGNPVTYYNGKDYTFTWTKGRQLASATVDGKQVSYTYDMSGVRSGKQVYTTSNQRTTTYTYTTLSGKVMRQQWETRNSDDTVYQAMQSLEFVYDDGNQPFAMIYKHGQTTELYYYVLNAQGDVIALLNSAGSLVASYNYGAWGNYSVHGADGKKTTDATFIGHINPLRYRGYYYDCETRLYYLQSRYYDFANCRFINADTFATTDANGFLSANMFAYCQNNPIALVDHDGNSATIVGAVLGFVVNAADALISGKTLEQAFMSGMVGAATGALAGFIADSALATGGMSLCAIGLAAVGNGFSSVLNTAGTAAVFGEKVDKIDLVISGVVGTAFGALGAATSDITKPLTKGISQFVKKLPTGISRASKQIVTEMSALSTGIGRKTLRTIRWDAAYSAVTSFGNWLHSKVFSKFLHS